jgi:hypothetical protein
MGECGDRIVGWGIEVRGIGLGAGGGVRDQARGIGCHSSWLVLGLALDSMLQRPAGGVARTCDFRTVATDLEGWPLDAYFQSAS